MKDRRKLTLHNMQILTITMSEYIQELFHLMKRIQEERRVSATLEEQVEMNDIAINLIESFMQLFEVHIDISRFHCTKFPSIHGYYI